MSSFHATHHEELAQQDDFQAQLLHGCPQN